MKFTMKIVGGNKLAKALAQLPANVNARVQRQALREGGELIRAHAASIAPREPGAPDIADNIGMSSARSIDEKEVAIKVGPTKGFAYGLPLELGTRHMSARAFLRPAFDAMAPAALAKILGSLWRAVISRGFGSARQPQETNETIAEPSLPQPVGGPGGGGLL